MELLSRAGIKETDSGKWVPLVGHPTSLPLHPRAGSINRACLIQPDLFYIQKQICLDHEGDLKASSYQMKANTIN